MKIRNPIKNVEEETLSEDEIEGVKDGYSTQIKKRKRKNK